MTELHQTILEKLKTVIDPETGADVIRMRLVEDLKVSQAGEVSYIFRPSSPICPIAVFLAQEIKKAVATVPGVTTQKIEVTGYVGADELNKLINQETTP